MRTVLDFMSKRNWKRQRRLAQDFTWTALPSTILSAVISHLSPHDHVMVMRVCHYLHSICYLPASSPTVVRYSGPAPFALSLINGMRGIQSLYIDSAYKCPAHGMRLRFDVSHRCPDFTLQALQAMRCLTELTISEVLTTDSSRGVECLDTFAYVTCHPPISFTFGQ